MTGPHSLPDAKELKRRARPFVLIAAGMLGLAYASVPLYDLFCRVTGFGGTPQERTELAETVLDRTIEVRFDASKGKDMPWEFKPLVNTVEIRIGETGLAFYEAYNPTDRPITGSAAFNVAPYSMGGYFVKVDCFCFVEQTLEPGERVRMPVTYYVDPEMIDDPEAEGVKTVTLSYTMYEQETETRAALD